MKKYTIHFLIITIVTSFFGFAGFTFPGDTAVRFIALIAGIGLMISCLDAVLLSRKQKRMRKEAEKSQDNK